MLSNQAYFFLVEKCSIDNGGCSHGCENPTQEGDDVTCNCDGTKLVFDPSGDQKTCGKSFEFKTNKTESTHLINN